MAATTRRNDIGSLWLPLLVLLLCVTVQARERKGNQVIFPGKDSRNPSPNGLYVLMNLDNAKMVPPHELLVKNTKSGSVTLILSYPRWVSTLWSPNGSALIVNDHAGSDYSDAYVYILGSSVARISVVQQLKKAFPNDPTLFLNDHVYVDGTRWLDGHVIRVEVHGHGSVDPNGFIEYFDYTLGGKIRRVAHRVAASN
jgi:hypothetical protein